MESAAEWRITKVDNICMNNQANRDAVVFHTCQSAVDK